MPQISILMAVYNGAKYVDIAVRSVLAQDFTDFEFVIVDDASSDDTADRIRSYNDPRIVYLRNDRNIGQTASLNRGLRACSTGLVARIDADDVFLPQKLSLQYAAMQARPDVAVCGTWAYRIDADGKRHGVRAMPTDPLDIRFRLLRGVPVGHVSVMMRRDVVVASGGYPEEYRFAADFALWSRLARAGAVIMNMPTALIEYREFPLSFGAAEKLGAAGDESASIIQQNAKALLNMEVPIATCRDTALLYFPEADVSPESVGRAYLLLLEMARQIYGSPPMRIRVDLFSAIFWAYVKRWGAAARRGTPRRREIGAALRHFRGVPTVFTAAAAAAVVTIGGPVRLTRLKTAMTQVINRRGGSA